jgi:hypothetical protein
MKTDVCATTRLIAVLPLPIVVAYHLHLSCCPLESKSQLREKQLLKAHRGQEEIGQAMDKSCDQSKARGQPRLWRLSARGEAPLLR